MSDLSVVAPVSPALSAYRSVMEDLKANRGSEHDGTDVLREISDATDDLVIGWFREMCANEEFDPKETTHCALMALGGYGRREMAPGSDVDLMLLHEAGLDSRLAEAFTKFSHLFFDARLPLGASVRSLEGALQFTDEDMESQTAMLESRFLYGSRDLAERFVPAIGKQVKKRARKYLDRKIAERNDRLASFGNSINVQEPDLKESPGGLRDYHQGIWLASIREGRKMSVPLLVHVGYIGTRDERRLNDALDRLFRFRCRLHWMVQGNSDLMRMDIQQQLAAELGYRDNDRGLAEERMMRDYYAAASVVRNFADTVTDRCRLKPRWWTWMLRERKQALADGFYTRGDELCIPDDLHFFENDPSRCLELFVHSARTGSRLSHEAERAVTDNRGLIDARLMKSSRAIRAVRSLLELDAPIAPALRAMDQLGVLQRVFPEWEHIRSLVRHDLLHRYTVDEHTLLALGYLETFGEQETDFSKERLGLYEGLADRALMRLLVFTHDIGKGYNRGHHEVGAELGEKIARRLRFSESSIESLVFLVKNHLVMSHSSQRQDVSDPHVCAEFAEFMESTERLVMLYLLTHVDVCAVRPDMMSAWKNHLLWQLYTGTRRVLDDPSGERTRPDEVMARRVKRAEEALGERFAPEVLREHLEQLPRDYPYRHDVETIAAHIELIQSFDGKSPAIDFRDHVNPAYQRVIVVTKDRVGLFLRLCMAMLLENFSIERAYLNTRSDGVVCNELVISDQVSPVRDARGGRQILRDRIRSLLETEGDPPRLPRPLGRQATYWGRYDTQVTVYNELSAAHNVVDIRTVDRPGLLLAITEVFSEMQLSIHYANLITEGDRVVDVFYLTDSKGCKVTDRGILTQLKERLRTALAEPASA